MSDLEFRMLAHGGEEEARKADLIFDVLERGLIHEEKKFKNCSTAMLSITFILMIGYLVAKFIQNKKTSFGTDVSIYNHNSFLKKSQDVHEMIKALIRVVERDMAPTLLVFFAIMINGSYYVIATILTFIFFAASGVLVIGHAKINYKLIMSMRVVIFLLTLCAFLNLFIDNMKFGMK